MTTVLQLVVASAARKVMRAIETIQICGQKSFFLPRKTKSGSLDDSDFDHKIEIPLVLVRVETWLIAFYLPLPY